ncbi:MAG: hypothetical protein RL385_2432 [Pseudomonadota bacterium]|jgi:hypothetical protein
MGAEVIVAGLSLQRNPLALIWIAKEDFGQDRAAALSHAELRRARTTPSLAERSSKAEHRE